MKELGIALLGLGNVGAGVVKLLEDNAAAIAARLGARPVVRAIAVATAGKKKRLVEVDPALLTTDIAKTIARADVDIVCELIGGEKEARDAVLQAIAAGKHVVTANKALLATHGEEIFAAAEARGVDVYYEAAVCGGIPVIRVLREGLASDRVEWFYGIVNGTSNYILTEMAAHGRAFGDVLKEAQKLGYAEADPTLDVSGGDAAHKLAILAMLCFGTTVDAAAIPKDGIDALDPIDFRYAAQFGFVIKPIVLGRDHGGPIGEQREPGGVGTPEAVPPGRGRSPRGIELRVHPAMIPDHWMLADVPGAKNALYVHSYALGPSLYYGAGAGMMPTAMSVVSDVIEIARNIAAAAGGGRIQRHRPLERKPALSIGDVRSRYYLRFTVEDRPGVLGRLTTVLGEHQVSIRQVVQDAPDAGAGESGPVSVVVLTHDAREGDVRAAIDAIAKTVVAPTKVIRVMGSP